MRQIPDFRYSVNNLTMQAKHNLVINSVHAAGRHLFQSQCAELLSPKLTLTNK